MCNTPKMAWTFYERNDYTNRIVGKDSEYFTKEKYEKSFLFYEDNISKGSNTFWDMFLSYKFAFIIDRYFDNSHLKQILKHLSDNTGFELKKIIILCLKEKKKKDNAVLSDKELLRIEQEREKENDIRNNILKKIRNKNIAIQYENILENEKIHDRFVILKNDYDENASGKLWIFGATFANIYDGLTVATYGWIDKEGELYKFFNNIINTNVKNNSMREGSSI